MGYDKRNPIFSFRLGEYRHGKLLRLSKLNKMPANDFLRSIVDQYLAGDLIPKAKDDLSVKMQELRLKKLQAETDYLNIKIKYYNNFGAPMSSMAARIIKPQVIDEPQKTQWVTCGGNDTPDPMSPYDESNKRLQCTSCGILFSWKNTTEFNSQIVEFQRHLVSKHNREMSAIERDVIIKLNYEGASV